MTMVGTLGKIGSPSLAQQSQLASRLRATSFKLVFSESATLFQQTQFSKINRHKFHSNANYQIYRHLAILYVTLVRKLDKGRIK